MDLTCIFEFFKNYGWQLGLLALSGIFVLGFLKWFGCFKKVNPNYKKYLYFGLSVAISIIACTIFIFAAHSFNWANYGALILAICVLTFTYYTIYENTGLRSAWNKVVLNNIAKLFHMIVTAIVSGTMTNDKIKDMAVKLGSDTLNQLAAEARVAEEKAKAEQQQQQNN